MGSIKHVSIIVAALLCLMTEMMKKKEWFSFVAVDEQRNPFVMKFKMEFIESIVLNGDKQISTFQSS